MPWPFPPRFWLLPVLERRAGRILVNGWPTGVEVCDAMVQSGGQLAFQRTADLLELSDILAFDDQRT